MGWLLLDTIGPPTPARLFLLTVGEQVPASHLLGPLVGFALGLNVDYVPLMQLWAAATTKAARSSCLGCCRPCLEQQAHLA